MTRYCLPVVLMMALLTGCATPYQSAGGSGGFTETQIAENVFRVSFRGNGYTKSERAEDFMLLRCADLAIKHGFTHFVLDGAGVSNDVAGIITPNPAVSGFVRKPTAAATVYMFKGKPDVRAMVYDARFVRESIRKKYGDEIGVDRY